LNGHEVLAARLAEVRQRVAAAAQCSGRTAEAVTLAAVTKTVSAAVAGEALASGVMDLGENRVQEGLAKQAILGRSGINWHLIGSLQTNKARKAAESFDLIHTLDRADLAQALSEAGERLHRAIPVLIQVNVSGEQSKHGLPPEDVIPFLAGLTSRPFLRPRGLMTMAPLTATAEETRPVFSGLRELFVRARTEFGYGEDWRWLSMGMSNDYEVAIEEGANLVRIGTAIFGNR